MAALGWLCLIPAAVLLALYVRERMKQRSDRAALAYINAKLGEFTDPAQPLTRQRLLVMTRDPELRELLRGINALLDRAMQSAAGHKRTERAMHLMLSNVSHDLKTPLTVIMGYAEMLSRQEGLAEDELRRMLGQVHKKTAEVHELINAFFDLSRLEADDYDIPLAVVDACEVCRRRVLDYFDLLAEQDYQVDIRLPDEPAWVYANEEALSRILDNLLSNAVRYGAAGRYLGLSLSRGDGCVRIEVKDRGRGIAGIDQARVFERMYTMEDSRNRHMQGSGLGLAIAKRLAERLGGRIELDSVPNVRTCFSLTLPASEYKPPPQS
ncbi:sensor histidine kinase [Cohnella hashimotonis]|uniref:histidine kinase n=1 Tax=Cohnella hashimotonis TaxID=2826895 RepID=A0ABT6TT38_9BACL|nr:HAMP domain-containing sensor histidine kinase [Cohnella hashimotonis]MDI4650021.1 HAMP domain-containing sensor histidine kinase [Cohnella hashimotonis]